MLRRSFHFSRQVKRPVAARDSLSNSFETSVREDVSPSFLDRNFVIPANVWGTGLVQLYENAKEGIQLWTNHGQDNKVMKREQIQFVLRTKKDLFKAVPLLLYFPFCVLFPTMPMLLKRFPDAFPSTMLKGEFLEHKMKQVEAKREQLASKILEDIDSVLEQKIKANPNDKSLLTLQKSLQSILASHKKKEVVTFARLIELLPLFQQHSFDLVRVNDQTAQLWADFLNVRPFGNAEKTRTALYQWMDWVLVDDQLIRAQMLSNKSCVNEALDQRGYIKIHSGSTHERELTLRAHFQFTVAVLEKLSGKKLPLSTASALEPILPEHISTLAGLYVIARSLNVHKMR